MPDPSSSRRRAAWTAATCPAALAFSAAFARLPWSSRRVQPLEPRFVEIGCELSPLSSCRWLAEPFSNGSTGS